MGTGLDSSLSTRVDENALGELVPDDARLPGCLPGLPRADVEVDGAAEGLLAADPHVLRESGLSTRKGETLRALAERFVDGRLSDEALSRMTDEEVEAALTEVPGIGPWTAHGFLLVALDRPDVFLPGDVALRRAIQRTYGIDHLPSEDELLEIADRWRPYRSLAVSYLFGSEYD